MDCLPPRLTHAKGQASDTSLLHFELEDILSLPNVHDTNRPVLVTDTEHVHSRRLSEDSYSGRGRSGWRREGVDEGSGRLSTWSVEFSAGEAGRMYLLSADVPEL
jgi:hypothetical protein